jgi:hypothetical protein
MGARITQIPLPGGSGLTPTGAMQFQDDWPGLFLRGDSAIHIMIAARSLQTFLRDCQDIQAVSALSVFGALAETIDHDVIVRHEDQRPS